MEQDKNYNCNINHKILEELQRANELKRCEIALNHGLMSLSDASKILDIDYEKIQKERLGI